MQDVDKLRQHLIDRQTISELAAASLFLFQLVSSFKKCLFGLETCYNSTLWYGNSKR